MVGRFIFILKEKRNSLQSEVDLVKFFVGTDFIMANLQSVSAFNKVILTISKIQNLQRV